ncbi:hypothetical protein GC173_16685 [bacterium]|nr:hypothetical protein [bacterium]
MSASAFEAVIDSFVEGVLARLGDFGLKESGLSSLWAEVREERHGSKEVQRLRKLEAMAGYDPDAAPDALAADLRSAPDMLGEGAVGEIAASARHDLVKVLKPIRALVKGKRAGADSGGFPARLPALEVGKARGNRNDEPWLQAYRAARFARRHWGLGSGPISDKQLASLIDAPPDVFSRSQRTALSLPMAVRAGDGTAQIYLDGTYPTTKRFAVGRLLGDQLLAGYDEPLIPATKAKTVRQRLQRAFSQELLCPVDAIKDRLWNKGKRASDDEIQRVADEFGVSPRLVSTTLVNNRVLDRDALDYTY